MIEKEITEHEIHFCVLSPNGDDRLVWDKRFPEQMKEAQERFYKLLDQGYKMFAVKLNGQKELIYRFDPSSEEVVAVKQVVCIPMLAGG